MCSDIEAVCTHCMPTILDTENSACYNGLFQKKSVPHYPPRQMDFCKFSQVVGIKGYGNPGRRGLNLDDLLQGSFSTKFNLELLDLEIQAEGGLVFQEIQVGGRGG